LALPLGKFIIASKVALLAKMVLKPHIIFECKAQADEKAEHTLVCEYFEEACNTAIEYYMGL